MEAFLVAEMEAARIEAEIEKHKMKVAEDQLELIHLCGPFSTVFHFFVCPRHLSNLP
jgi:hypothetical protein